jgi:hypothetical protein
MTRILLTLPLFALTALAADSAPRWNVLHIVADDLRNALGCYVVRTPHPDRHSHRLDPVQPALEVFLSELAGDSPPRQTPR